MGFDWRDGQGRRVVADDTTRTVTEYDPDGTVRTQRAYTPDEVAALEQQLQQQEQEQQQQRLLEDIRGAVDHIVAVRDLARDDQAVAVQLRDGALAISSQLATQSAQIAAWTPGTTYRASDLTAMKGQVKILADRQKQVADALADFYAYRRANDEAMVTAYNALLWVAQQLSGRVEPLGLNGP